MTQASLAPDPRGRDGLEPPDVGAGRLLLWSVVVFVSLFAAAASLWGAYRWRVGHLSAPTAAAFPAPRLETNQTPRATLSTSHGPGPYRLKAAPLRAGEAMPGDALLEAAMRAEASRGAAAYDPLATRTAGS